MDNGEARSVELFEETLGADLLEALIDELKKAEKGWGLLDQYQTDQSIARLRLSVRKLIHDALWLLFGGSYPIVQGELSKVSFGDGISAAIKIAKKADNRHELADATGSSVLIVVANPEKYLTELDSVKETAQPDLFDQQQPGTVLEFPVPGAADAPKVIEENNASRDAHLPAQAQEEESPPSRHWLEELVATLQAIGYPATIALVSEFTPAQFDVALDWAKRKRDYPATLMKMPDFLPVPPTNNAQTS